MSSFQFPPTDNRSNHARGLLSNFGWSRFWEDTFTSSHCLPLEPARVIEEHRNRFRLVASSGEFTGECSSKILSYSNAPDCLPAVGDWVSITIREDRQAMIHDILPRRTVLARRATGGIPESQLIAANVDTVLIVSSLDHDFNLSRLERYLVFVATSHAKGIILLNKSDLHDNPSIPLEKALGISGGTPVFLVSAHNGTGIPELRSQLLPGSTYVLVGSSGAGKSTLVNALFENSIQRTQPVRARDHGGQHTTTSRQLMTHLDGWVLLDTPGIRALGLIADDYALEAEFSDITMLATECRFRDCSHRDEPGCAIKAAIKNQTLDSRRLSNFIKLGRELDSLKRHRIKQERILAKSVIRATKNKRSRGIHRMGDEED